MFEVIRSRSRYFCNIIKKFDLSTLDTTIPHAQLKSRLKRIDSLLFLKEDRRTEIPVSCYWISLTLSKAIQTLMININVMRSTKSYSDGQHIYFFMTIFDRVNGPIDMRVWKGRRFENILKLDRDLR